MVDIVLHLNKFIYPKNIRYYGRHTHKNVPMDYNTYALIV